MLGSLWHLEEAIKKTLFTDIFGLLETGHYLTAIFPARGFEDQVLAACPQSSQSL